MLRCTHESCASRIKLGLPISLKNALCEKHDQELRGSVKDMIKSWAKVVGGQEQDVPGTTRRESAMTDGGGMRLD
jgi:hypothetical protein